jgi:hypothetical protein
MNYQDEFEEEIILINDEHFSDFAMSALNKVPTFQMDSNDVEHVKRVVKNVVLLSEELDIDTTPRNIFIVAALLHAICKYDEIDEGFDKPPSRDYDFLHMLHVRSYLTDLQHLVGRDNFNDIMLLIESQAGFNSPIPQIMQNADDPAHMWILPFAIKLAGG